MTIVVDVALWRPVGSVRRWRMRERRRSKRHVRRFLARNTVTLTIENRSSAAFEFTASFIGWSG